MADRTSAELFEMLFRELAKREQTEEVKSLAKKIWGWTMNYDFSPYQMDANDALIKLGLAKHIPDPEDPEYQTIQYADGMGVLH